MNDASKNLTAWLLGTTQHEMEGKPAPPQKPSTWESKRLHSFQAIPRTIRKIEKTIKYGNMKVARSYLKIRFEPFNYPQCRCVVRIKELNSQES